jgi:alginate O-acetyltransferase complex protein AlgI
MKAKDFLPQIEIKRFADVDWNHAIRCLILGYFLKMVIANNLQEQTFFMQAPYFHGFSSTNLVFLLFGYSAQIFADFAGYSLIAIGLAKLLGYRLPDNFNFPYISQSVAEFWRRWHMSLSSWLRDYLYIPLGGSRLGPYRTYANLLIVMTLGGLWHGAAWSFAVWGIWHGLGLALERPFLGTRLYAVRNRILAPFRVLGVFVFVSLGWLLFKLTDFADAVGYVLAVGGNWSLPVGWLSVALIALYSLPVLIWHAYHLCKPAFLARLRNPAYSLMIFLIAMNPGRKAAFIYFQF